MKTKFYILFAAVFLMFCQTTAEAQQRQHYRGGGYHGGHNYRGGHNTYNNSFNRNVYVKNNGWGNGAGWAAAGIGLGLLGGALLAAPSYGGYAAPYPVTPVYPSCRRVWSYDIYGNGFWQTVCN